MKPTSAPPGLSLVTRRAVDIDLVCLSHLRWDFVFQRPQHLLSRAAATRRVFFVEEPIVEERTDTVFEIEPRAERLFVARVRTPAGRPAGELLDLQRRLLTHLMARHRVRAYMLWYYTPMALDFSRHLAPELCVYDCMDELSCFKGAPEGIRAREDELFARAHVVFCGGHNLYEFKRGKHGDIHPFPSSIDAVHFARARSPLPEPADQARIAGPRLGFFGVLDERFDRDLVGRVAAARPDWQFVFLGPVVKIDPADLPRLPNLHYLGPKPYAELPSYIAGWDVALMPFAMNESTRFISPTKTPEYLAAGRPVVSTPIRDVVRPYGEMGLVEIAAEAPEFVAACERALLPPASGWLARVDAFLAQTSWDLTWQRMTERLEAALARRAAAASRKAAARQGVRPAIGEAAAE